jgi:hypothetical protein
MMLLYWSIFPTPYEDESTYLRILSIQQPALNTILASRTRGFMSCTVATW